MSHLYIVCPSCNSTNRVPAQKLHDRPHCGQCKKLLFQNKPLEADADAFNKQIKKSDIPILVDFWAPWCGPCRMMAPAFAQAASQLEPQVRLLKLNTEDFPQIAAQYGIRGIPTMVLFHKGREIDRLSGAISAPEIIRWVQQRI